MIWCVKMNKHRKDTSNGSFRSLFMHADSADMFLMAVGLIGAIGDGMGFPVTLLFTTTTMNSIGGSSSVSADVYTDKINKVNFKYTLINQPSIYSSRNQSKLRFNFLLTECCLSLLLGCCEVGCMFSWYVLLDYCFIKAGYITIYTLAELDQKRESGGGGGMWRKVMRPNLYII
ncbi:putative ABC transporter type 1, transmembrane domain superfamily [Helianthus annuus]|nr:putative ABC transporter type 1, transmembrane domain superfamily [Helianthus annuus]